MLWYSLRHLLPAMFSLFLTNRSIFNNMVCAYRACQYMDREQRPTQERERAKQRPCLARRSNLAEYFSQHESVTVSTAIFRSAADKFCAVSLYTHHSTFHRVSTANESLGLSCKSSYRLKGRHQHCVLACVKRFATCVPSVPRQMWCCKQPEQL